MPGGFSGVRLDHTLADIGRSVLEGAGFELRWAVENIRAFGFSIEGLWMVGGATRSRIWPQILADISGIPISLTQYSHGPALGAAILAAQGLGLIDNFPQWVSAQTKEPNSENARIYNDCYAAYRQMTDKLL
jgi:L-xylulokinase